MTTGESLGTKASLAESYRFDESHHDKHDGHHHLPFTSSRAFLCPQSPLLISSWPIQQRLSVSDTLRTISYRLGPVSVLCQTWIHSHQMQRLPRTDGVIITHLLDSVSDVPVHTFKMPTFIKVLMTDDFGKQYKVPERPTKYSTSQTASPSN